MLSDISGRLTGLVEKKREKSKLQQDLAQVERGLKEKTLLLDDLERALKKEQVDVERLEGFSLTKLITSVTGKYDEQMDKERQELLAAQLKYQQAKRAVDGLRADQEHLTNQLNGLRSVENDYAALLGEKETLLRQSNAPAAAELMGIAERLANRKAEAHELDEAIAAANRVLASLKQVIESLESAEGWGTWDMLGGGFLSTAIKHSRIDDAREAVQDVQVNMRRFTRELADVQRTTDLTINIGEIDVFADYFFDGLIMDWIVQSKIRDSLERSVLAREQINRAVRDLERLKASAISDAQRLNAQRDAILTSS